MGKGSRKGELCRGSIPFSWAEILATAGSLTLVLRASRHHSVLAGALGAGAPSTHPRFREPGQECGLSLNSVPHLHRVLLCFSSYYKQSYRKPCFTCFLANLRNVPLCFPLVEGLSPKSITFKVLTDGAQLLFRSVRFTLPSIIKQPCFPAPSLKLVPNFSITSPIEREEILSHCFYLQFFNYERSNHFFMSTGLLYLFFCQMPVQILCLICNGLFIYKRSFSFTKGKFPFVVHIFFLSVSSVFWI